MTVYEILLSEMKTVKFLHLIKSGIIPIIIMDYKMYYEMYLSERKKGQIHFIVHFIAQLS